MTRPVVIDLAELAASLGLGVATGEYSPIQKSLRRLVRFGLAARHGNQLAVRTTAPPLSQRQLDRLTPRLQAAHQSLTAARTPTQTPTT